MNPHNIFYYPYASFTDVHAPLLKAAAIYFDKLYILDPLKATGGTVGIGNIEHDVALLEQAGILERVAPEEVLRDNASALARAIAADWNDPEFVTLCRSSGRARYWRIALAKVPKEIRIDPGFQLFDQSMQWLLGDLPKQAPEGIRPEVLYEEDWGIAGEEIHSVYFKPYVFDEVRRSSNRDIEYRYADLSLPLGESIMINHALFASVQYKGAIPLTDDPFHSKVLSLKLKRASELSEVRNIIAERAVRQNLLAISTLTDTQLNLPALSPQIPLEHILEYRHKHADDLQQARDRLGWIARQIEQNPWSKEFETELEHKTIPAIAKELEEVRKARDTWLKSQRGRLALKAVGIGLGVASTVIGLMLGPSPLLPVAIALVSSAGIPSIEAALDWRDGKKSTTSNGLHYLLDFKSP